MVNLRSLLIVVAVSAGFGSAGCSESLSPEPTPSANQHDGQTLAAGSDQARPQVQWWRDELLLAKIEPTDDQLQAINDLMAVTVESANQQRQQERQLSLRYLRALSQEPYDPALVDRVSERLIEVLSSEQSRRIENVRALRDILTQEQWTKLWDAAPQVLQIGRFRAMRGPKIAVTDDPNPSPTPTP